MGRWSASRLLTAEVVRRARCLRGRTAAEVEERSWGLRLGSSGTDYLSVKITTNTGLPQQGKSEPGALISRGRGSDLGSADSLRRGGVSSGLTADVLGAPGVPRRRQKQCPISGNQEQG